MPQADLVLKNARILTMNPARPAASLLAVKDGRILFAGDTGDIASFQGSETRTIDCTGLTVVPGFNDAHCHIFSFLRKLLSIDLSPEAVKSIADIKAAVKLKVAQTMPGEWITGTDYSDFYLAEKRHPTRWEIDEVASANPVMLSHKSLHACVLNSRALELAGITGESEEPAGGTILRDLETGEPNGVLLDMVGYIRENVMPGMTEEETEKGMELAGRHYISHGITSLQDATFVNDYSRWRKYVRFKEKDILKSRLYIMTGYDRMHEFMDAGLQFLSGDSHLRLGHVKIVPSETAEGRIFPEQSEMNSMVLDIHRAGFRVAIHAVRHETVASAVEAVENTLGNEPLRDHRNRIEHCSECPDELLKRIREAGICIATQPPFLYYSGERYLATVPADRQPMLYRIKSMLDAGLTVAGSSDSPIVNDDPLTGIYSAVNRRAETGQILQHEERISPEQALMMYTANAARVSFEENSKGTLEPGKVADIAVLDGDPTSVSPEEIRDISVVMTIIDGKVVWEK